MPANWSFHDALIDSLRNAIVSNIYRVNSIRIRLIRLERVVLSAEVLLPALREHAEVVTAIQARDPEGAAQALQRHLVSAQNRAMGFFVVGGAVAPPAGDSGASGVRPAATTRAKRRK